MVDRRAHPNANRLPPPYIGAREPDARRPPSHRATMLRFWIGTTLFVVGGALWLLTRGRPRTDATSVVLSSPLPRFGLAAAALGLAVLASTREGLGWSVSAIGFSLVSIVLLLTLLLGALRR